MNLVRQGGGWVCDVQLSFASLCLAASGRAAIPCAASAVPQCHSHSPLLCVICCAQKFPESSQASTWGIPAWRMSAECQTCSSREACKGRPAEQDGQGQDSRGSSGRAFSHHEAAAGRPAPCSECGSTGPAQPERPGRCRAHPLCQGVCACSKR